MALKLKLVSLANEIENSFEEPQFASYTKIEKRLIADAAGHLSDNDSMQEIVYLLGMTPGPQFAAELSVCNSAFQATD